MFKLLGIDEAPEPQFMSSGEWPARRNRHDRRALQSIARRMGRGIRRAARVFDTPAGEGARIHVASLWKRYVQLTGDIRPL